MTVTGQDLQAALRQAAVGWRDLARRSQPSRWAWTGLPFLAGAFDAERGLSVALVVGALYFLVPFNLLRHGVGEVIDERGRPTVAGLPMAIAIAVTNVPLLLVLAYLGGPAATLTLVVVIGVSIAAGVPLVRSHPAWPAVRPFAEGTVIAGAALCGQLVGGRDTGAVPWTILLALWLWAVAASALSALGPADAPGPVEAGPPLASDAAPADRSTGGPRFGPRRIAALALAADVVAVGLLARHGPLGLLAAAGVALYLALPVMVLAASDHPGAVGTAVGRAARDRPGLDLLVGTWLAVLLVRHFGLLTYTPWEAAVVLATVVTGYVLGAITLTWIATRRHRPPAARYDAPVPSVAIVVPIRDDAERLGPCLAAIRSQTYADTVVLVVDEGSQDGSASEAAAWLGDDAVIVAPPRPDGWGSRDWARHVGATTADTDLVLFVDADTVLAPIATRILVEQQQATGTDLLSGLTRFDTPTVGERAAVPSFPLVLFGLVPVWWSALSGGRPPSIAVATATLLLVRRATYLATVDPDRPPAEAAPGGRLDLGLARAVARSGRSVQIVHAADLGATRHHRDVTEVLDAWRRVIAPPRAGGLATAVATLLVEVVGFVMPLALPAIAVLSDQSPALVGVASLPLALLLAARVVLVATQRQSPTTIAWHPVTILIALIGQIAGIADHIAGRAPKPVAATAPRGPSPAATPG